jgi:hypothetical protein
VVYPRLNSSGEKDVKISEGSCGDGWTNSNDAEIATVFGPCLTIDSSIKVEPSVEFCALDLHVNALVICQSNVFANHRE